MDRKALITLIACISIIDALVIGVLLGVLKKSPLMGLTVGLLALAAPFGMIVLVMWLCRYISGWGSLAEEFPAQTPPEKPKWTPAPELAVRSQFMRFSNLMRWRVDDDYLHLEATLNPMNAMPGLSIPWAAIEIEDDPKRARNKLVPITAGATKFWVPRASVERELEVRRAIAAAEAPTPHADRGADQSA